MSSRRAVTASRSSHSSRSYGHREAANENTSNSPGPQNYNVRNDYTRFGSSRAPSFTMGKRITHSADTGTPGPGRYYPEKSPEENRTQFKREHSYSGPGFSLCGRTKLPLDDNRPGPASYTLPPVMGTNVPNRPRSAAASITGRISQHPEGYGRSPGPAKYEVPDANAYKTKNPQYSIFGRKNDPSKIGSTNTPSPSTYQQNYTSTKSKSGFSFGCKHSTKRANLILPQDQR